GGYRKCCGNCLQYALPVCHYIVVIEAKNAKSFRREKGIKLHVALRVCVFKMLPAVQLNNQIGCVTDKICDVRADRSLAAEACAIQTMSAKRVPDHSL